MKRARNPWLPVLRALSLAALGSIWALACGGPQQQGAAGSVCFRTDDCKDGLACVPTAKGSSKSVCSTDLSGIVAMVDGAPPDAPAPTGDASAGTGGAAQGGAAGKGGAADGGAGGKPAGGATGMAGSGTAGKSSGGAPAGGAPTGGAPSGGTGTSGSGTAGSSTGGTGGSEPVDAGDG